MHGCLYDNEILINPYDIDDIKSAMKKIVNNEISVKDLINKGYENVKRFSWEHSAKKINKIIEKIVEK